jgi:hypothetical protein
VAEVGKLVVRQIARVRGFHENQATQEIASCIDNYETISNSPERSLESSSTAAIFFLIDNFEKAPHRSKRKSGPAAKTDMKAITTK